MTTRRARERGTDPLTAPDAPRWVKPMPVRDCMHHDPVVVRGDVPIAVAVHLLRTRKIRHLPVVDAGGRLVGIVTDRGTVAQIDRALPLLDTELSDAVRAFIASSLEGDLEWAAQVHDARTAPRARLEPTWVIHSDWHALFPHVHGVP